MDFLISLHAFVGLSHGDGRPHYSTREYLGLLAESELSPFPVTVTVGLGREKGSEEDTVVLQLDAAFTSFESLDLLCRTLSDFLSRVFRELGQQRIHIRYLISANGRPLRHATLEVDKEHWTSLQPSHLFVENMLLDQDLPKDQLIELEGLVARAHSANPRIVEQLLIAQSERLSESTGMTFLWEDPAWSEDGRLTPELWSAIRRPNDLRLWAILAAMRRDFPTDRLQHETGLTTDFFETLRTRVEFEIELLRDHLTRELLLRAKRLGFSLEEIGLLQDLTPEQVRWYWRDWRLPHPELVRDVSRISQRP